MSDSQLKRSVKQPPLSSGGVALIVLCVTFLLSVSVNIYQFLVSCQDAHRIATLANTVQVKTNKNDRLQNDLDALTQPDAVSSASDGDPPPMITVGQEFEKDVLVCTEHPVQALILSPFIMTSGTQYYPFQTWESLRFITEDSVCYKDWPARTLSSYVLRTCIVMVENTYLGYYNWSADRLIRGPY